MSASYTLDSAVETHREFPDTFHIPPQAERGSLRPGDLVKLMFRIQDGEFMHVERMWVIVEEVRPEFYVGVLDNDPYCTAEIHSGQKVQFHSDHVIEIDHRKV